MRNEGNTADGLIVRMSSSYFTEMSFIPPNNAIIEDGTTNIRSFEVIDIEKGSNFTFKLGLRYQMTKIQTMNSI